VIRGIETSNQELCYSLASDIYCQLSEEVGSERTINWPWQRRAVILDFNHLWLTSALANLIEENPQVSVVEVASSDAQLDYCLNNNPVDYLFVYIDNQDNIDDDIAVLLELRSRVDGLAVITNRLVPHSLSRLLDIDNLSIISPLADHQELVQTIEALLSDNSFICAETESILEVGTSCLSRREEQVVRMIVLGYTGKEIASKLYLSAKTIESHRASATRKINARSRRDLVEFAFISNLLLDA